MSDRRVKSNKLSAFRRSIWAISEFDAGVVLAVVLAMSFALLGSNHVARAQGDEGNSARREPEYHEPLSPADRAPREGVLTLINGDTVQGSIRQAARADSVFWQGVNFDRPFEFRLGSVRSIKFPTVGREDEQAARHLFELTNGDVIHGQLLRLSAESAEIDCSSLGIVSIRLGHLSRLQRMDLHSTVPFTALRGMEGWINGRDDGPLWHEDGDQVWTDQPDSVLIGDVQLANRATIELELSWSDKPDFAIALAIDPSLASDAAHDGWRLETAGDALMAVHESEQHADVARVADLAMVDRIRLFVQLAQTDRSMQVFLPDGSLLGGITLPRSADADPATTANSVSPAQRGVRLVNRGQSLRLERFQVSQWAGTASRAEIPQGHSILTMVDGSQHTAQIIGYDAESGALQITSGDPATSYRIALADVAGVRFTPPAASAQSGQSAWFLVAGGRVSGSLLAVDDKGWVLRGDAFLGEIKLPHDRVRTMVVFDSEAANVESKPVLGRVGRLEFGADRLSGRLVPSDGTATPGDTPLVWHPLYSLTSAALREAVSGRIVYRDALKVDKQSTAARMLEQQRLRNQQQRRGLNFGELFLQRSDLSKSNPVKRNANVVHCRSGDVIPCQVDAIDDSGVLISTANSARAVIPHAQIKAVEFVSNSPPPSIEQAKRERLLTIPRLQKSDPPSHLLCSHNGDFLRCNVLQTENDLLRVQVQLEQTLIPRNRIAQIIWFHRDEYQAEPPSLASDSIATAESEGNANGPTSDDQRDNALAVGEYRGLVQAVLADGKRATFTPTAVVDGLIDGISPWVGPCRFDLGSVDQLLIGSAIKSEVAEFAYNQWKLRPAVEPLVTAAMQDDASSSGRAESALVGTPAPEIMLKMLDGSDFDLAQNNGQVTVLAFWASWSAPSMDLLPQLIDAVGQFDSGMVRLVTVNLQESTEQVRSALVQRQLQPLVALDRDGVAAQRFQATVIPQIVVVAADGEIMALHIGGGSDVLKRLKDQIAQFLDSAILSTP